MGTVASLPAAGLGMAQPQPCGKDEEMALCGAELLFQGNGGWWRGMEANGADLGGKGVAASIWPIEGNGGQQRGMEVSGANGGEWRGRCGQWSGMEAKGAYPGENGAFWRHSGISVILFRIGFLCIFFSLLSQLSSSSSSAQLWALRHLLPIDGALGHVPTCPYASLEPQTQR